METEQLDHKVDEDTEEHLAQLKRQRDELLSKKKEKEQQLAELLPPDVPTLIRQRELLLAMKAEKEQQLAEATKLQNSKSEKRKRGRPKKGDEGLEEEDLTITKKFKSSELTPPPGTGAQESNGMMVDWQHFQELKVEHKRGRKLLKEQKKQLEAFERESFERLDSLQHNLNRLLEHLTNNAKLQQDGNAQDPENKLS